MSLANYSFVNKNDQLKNSLISEGRNSVLAQNLVPTKPSRDRYKPNTNAITQHELSVFQSQIMQRNEENALESLSSHHFNMNFPGANKRKADKSFDQSSHFAYSKEYKKLLLGQELLNDDSHPELRSKSKEKSKFALRQNTIPRNQLQRLQENYESSQTKKKSEGNRQSSMLQLPEIPDNQLSLDEESQETQSRLQKKKHSIQSRVERSSMDRYTANAESMPDRSHALSVMEDAKQLSLQHRREKELKLLKNEVVLLSKQVEQHEMEELSKDPQREPQKESYWGVKNTLNFYLGMLRQYQQRILKKFPLGFALHEKLLEELSGNLERLESHFDLEGKKSRLLIDQLQRQLELEVKKNEELEKGIDQEKKHLKDLFEKTQKDGLSELVSDWENQKTISQLASEQNMIPKPLDFSLVDEEDEQVYSGLLGHLKELLGSMTGNAVNLSYLEGVHLSDNSDYVLRKIEREIEERFKSVQKTTAQKVLRRFYRNVKVAEVATQVEEDPLKLEILRLEEVIEDLRMEKEIDRNQITSISNQMKEMSGARLQQQIALRQGKEQLKRVQELLDEKEGFIKEQNASIKYLNEQIQKYVEQVKELMSRGDDYDSKISMLRENMFSMDDIIRKKKEKIQQIKNRNQGFDALEAHSKIQEAALQSVQKNLETQELRYTRLVEERDRQDRRLAAYTRLAMQQKQTLIENNIEPPQAKSISDHIGSASEVSYRISEQEEDNRLQELEELEELMEEDAVSQNSESIQEVAEEKAEELAKDERENVELTQDEAEALKSLMNELGFNLGEFDERKKDEYMEKIDSWFQTTSQEDWVKLIMERIGKAILKKILDNRERLERKRTNQLKKQRTLQSKKTYARQFKQNSKKFSEKKGFSPPKKRESDSLSNIDIQNEKDGISEFGIEQNKSNIDQHSKQTSFKSRKNPASSSTKMHRYQTLNLQKEIVSRNSMSKYERSYMERDERNSFHYPEIKVLEVPDEQELDAHSLEIDQQFIEIGELKSQYKQVEEQEIQEENGELVNRQQSEQLAGLQVLKESSSQPRQMTNRSRSNRVSEDRSFQKSGSNLLEIPRNDSVHSLGLKMQAEASVSKKSSRQSFNKQGSRKLVPEFSNIQIIQQVAEQEEELASPTLLQTLSQSQDTVKNESVKLNLLKNDQIKISPHRKLKKDASSQSKTMLTKQLKRSQERTPEKRLSPIKFQRYEDVVFKPQKKNKAELVQTDLSGIDGELFKNKNICEISTQTDDFMFSLEDDAKRRLNQLVGMRLPKHGDKFDKGSAMFTQVSLVKDESDPNMQLDIYRSLGSGVSIEYNGENNPQIVRRANGVIVPKHKEFQPVLKKKFKEYF